MSKLDKLVSIRHYSGVVLQIGLFENPKFLLGLSLGLG